MRSPRPALALFLRCALAVILAAPNSAAATSQQLFAPPVTYAAGYSPVSIAVGDLNGDGISDLVAASSTTVSGGPSGPGSVNVLLGNGDGALQSAVSYTSSGYNTGGVALGDLNGDGKLDIVAVNSCATIDTCQNGGTVSILFGNGDGTFQPAVTFASGPPGSGPLIVADFNGDGNLDLAVVSLYGSVSVLLGNGNGTFQTPVSYLTGGTGSTLATVATTADLRGDGILDLVIPEACGIPIKGACSTSVISVLLGNGDGTFQPATTYATGGESSSFVAAGDLNGDGKIDLAVANLLTAGKDAGTVSIFLGNGDGTFQGPTSYSSSGVDAEGIVMKDFNGDGKLDVAVVNQCSPKKIPGCLAGVDVLLGTGTGTLQQSGNVYSLGTGGAGQAAVADLNGDGKPDLAVVAGGVTVLLNIATPPTTTALSSTLNPSTYGQSVTFTASVSSPATAEGLGTPVGSVTFEDGSNTLGTSGLSGGVATITTSSLSVGSHSITAVYAGGANFAGSASKGLPQTVKKAPTSTTLTSSANPITLGQSVTFTATVSSGAGAPPDGDTVTFKNGSATLGTGTLSIGVATFTTLSLPAGNDAITATYSGDANFSTSRSATLKEMVNQ